MKGILLAAAVCMLPTMTAAKPLLATATATTAVSAPHQLADFARKVCAHPSRVYNAWATAHVAQIARNNKKEPIASVIYALEQKEDQLKDLCGK